MAVIGHCLLPQLQVFGRFLSSNPTSASNGGGCAMPVEELHYYNTVDFKKKKKKHPLTVSRR